MAPKLLLEKSEIASHLYSKSLLIKNSPINFPFSLSQVENIKTEVSYHATYKQLPDTSVQR